MKAYHLTERQKWLKAQNFFIKTLVVLNPSNDKPNFQYWYCCSKYLFAHFSYEIFCSLSHISCPEDSKPCLKYSEKKKQYKRAYPHITGSWILRKWFLFFSFSKNN